MRALMECAFCGVTITLTFVDGKQLIMMILDDGKISFNYSTKNVNLFLVAAECRKITVNNYDTISRTRIISLKAKDN